MIDPVKSLTHVTVSEESNSYSIIDYLRERRAVVEELYDSYDRARVQAMQKIGTSWSSLDDILNKYGL